MTDINYGFIGAIILLLGFGGSMILTAEQQSQAYVCSVTQQVYLCESLSSTNKTCYWTVNDTKKSAVCSNGNFSRLEIEPQDEVVPIVPVPVPVPVVPSPIPIVIKIPFTQEPIKYSCNFINCTRI